MSDATEKMIKNVLDQKVNPVLSEHFGGAVLNEYTDEGIAYIGLTGDCASCMAAEVTMEEVVKPTIMAAIPAVKDVVLDQRIDEDLLEMVRGILRKENKLPGMEDK